MDKDQRWPVTIGIIYGIFVLLLIGFVIFSTFNSVDLVTSDYYRQEIAYQSQIDRLQRSRPLAWHYDREKALLLLQFPDTLRHQNIAGKVHFYRPSDARQDRFELIRTDSDNRQIISTSNIHPGFWRVRITWQYNNREYYDEIAVFIR